MFSKVIEQEKTPREETVNPSSEDLLKRTEESPRNQENFHLSTTMAKEEISNQLNSLQEEVKQAREYQSIIYQQEQMKNGERYYQAALTQKQRNEELKKANNTPFENQQKFQEDQQRNKTLKLAILEKRGGLYNNPPKPKPVVERPMENFWDKKSYNRKYADLQKSKVNRGLSNIRK